MCFAKSGQRPVRILVTRRADAWRATAEEEVPVYRGGNSFELKAGEYKINKETGMVKNTHGVSLDVDPNTVSKYGGAYKIDFLPKGLKIIQRGQRMEHFEIVPEHEMTVEEFQNLLNKIETSFVK